VPLLFIPPTINKFYVLDLAPGRSMIEHLIEQGQQVFAISWRNPDEHQAHFDLDTYADAVLEARDAIAEITGQDAVHLNAACSGGIITAGLLGHLAAEETLDGVASLTLMVCALDNERMGTTSALATREMAAAAVAESARKGYLDGRALAGVFAWLRPNDLIWGYVVNNYLLGKAPPAFDILYWNQDSVRLAAGLHRDFIGWALENALTRPGGLSVLGTPVDLHTVGLDS
jgi:polyhydroxyalkanoate synthase subunit PhaC